jgi:hypothetical protein
LRLLQQHVDKGNADAQCMLAEAYSGGRFDLKKSLKRGLELHRLAAAQGHAQAQQALGISYAQGIGVETDEKAAVLWFRRAAEQGYPLAQYNVGVSFYHGRGVTQSYDETVRWLRLAAAQGEPDGLCNLATCYVNGQGVPQDDYEALRLYKRAAAEGHADAALSVQLFEAALARQRSA